MSRPLLLAHRGDHRAAPENTLAAFRAALEADVDGIELDVRTSSDGEAIVLHDETLSRVQGVAGEARLMTAAELGRLGVPRLRDVLDVVPPDMLLDIELKVPAISAVRDAVGEVRGPAARGLVFSSFDEATLIALATAEPDWPRWLIGSDALALARASALGCSGVALEWRAIDAAMVAAARESALTLMAWTLRDVATRDRLVALGVDRLCVEGEALGQRFGSASGGRSH